MNFNLVLEFYFIYRQFEYKNIVPHQLSHCLVPRSQSPYRSSSRHDGGTSDRAVDELVDFNVLHRLLHDSQARLGEEAKNVEES